MNTQRGTAGTLVVVVAAVVLFGVIATWMSATSKAPVRETTDESRTMTDGTDVMEATGAESEDVTESGNMQGTSGDPLFTGTILGGAESPLLEFTEADYEKALTSDRLVVLYFYANWCPYCRAEFPVMQEVFNTLEGEEVVGFRVNYNDNETTDAEKAVARAHGVAYQHTKVFLKDGERVLKSPETWDRDRYVSEITQFNK